MRVFVLAVLSVLVEFCHGEWACEENNGWLHYVDDDGKAVCRVDSFRANCDAFSGARNMLCIVVGPIIYSYAKTQSDCDAAAECINAYPTFYADKYPRLPTCAKFVADAATYGKDLAGIYYVLQGDTGTTCSAMAKGLDSAELCGENTCNDHGTCTNNVCTCTAGWSGQTCGTADKCNVGANGGACANGGEATGTTGNCGCKCAGNWNGANCGQSTTTATTTSATTKTATTKRTTTATSVTTTTRKATTTATTVTTTTRKATTTATTVTTTTTTMRSTTATVRTTKTTTGTTKTTTTVPAPRTPTQSGAATTTITATTATTETQTAKAAISTATSTTAASGKTPATATTTVTTTSESAAAPDLPTIAPAVDTEASSLFQRLDTNKDRALSAKEISKGLSGVNKGASTGGGGGRNASSGGAGGNSTAAAWVEVVGILVRGGAVDTSSDGTISTEEFIAFFDKDADFEVSEAEFISGLESVILFNRLDADKDGTLSATEIAKGLSSVNTGGGGGGGNVQDWSYVTDTLIQAGAADTSSDGTISTEEFVAFFDADADYGVTRPEFETGLDAILLQIARGGGKVTAAPSVDTDDDRGNGALIQDDDAAVPSAKKSRAGMIVGVILAVLLIVVAAVLVYMFFIAADKDKIPRTATLDGSGRAIANPLYPGLEGYAESAAGGVAGVSNQMYGTAAEQHESAGRTGGAVTNPMYAAPVMQLDNMVQVAAAAGPIYAIPVEDAQAVVVESNV